MFGQLTEGRPKVDPTKHNYYKKLLLLHEQGKISTVSLTEVDVYHDDWCTIHTGEYCNCDPNIKLRRQLRAGSENRSGIEPRGTKASDLEETVPLQAPTDPCPHCGGKEFVVWQAPDNPQKQAISCDACGAVMSSTHALDQEDRPMRRP
jgi:hypothetical protein